MKILEILENRKIKKETREKMSLAAKEVVKTKIRNKFGKFVKMEVN